MHELLTAIKRASGASVWSQGVRLARDNKVSGQSADDDEIVLRVQAPGRAVAVTVVLYPEDLEWECDCPSRADTCAHVAAAVIALDQARKDGRDLPAGDDQGGELWYRFARPDGATGDGGLRLMRVVVTGDGAEHPLKGTLSGLLSGREAGPAVRAEQADLNIDRILGTRVRGSLPPTTLANVLIALADHPRVAYGGRRVTVSPDLLLPQVVVRNHKRGARVTIEPATAARKSPTEILAIGVVLCADTIYRLGEMELTGGKLELLPRVFDFARERLGELRTSFLPGLAGRLDIDDQTHDQPDLSDELTPRIAFKLEQDGRRLTVLPTLVYGEQPNARIDGERMVHLSGAIPVRDMRAEKRVLARLRDALDLQPGRTVNFEDQDAVRFMQRYRAFVGRGPGQARELAVHLHALEPRLTIDGDRLELYFETVASDGDTNAGANTGSARATLGQRLDAESVLAAWRDGLDTMVFSARGATGWAQLPVDWLQRFGPRVADLLSARADNGQLAGHAIFDLARLCADLDHPPPADLDRLRPLIDGFEGLPEPDLPADLTAELRPYQRQGVAWLSFLRDAGLGATLADDMGLGKTLQALCTVRGPTLVVCPTSVLPNWASEAARFRPTLRVTVYHGPRRALPDAPASGQDDGQDIDLVLTTYALLRLDIDKLAAVAWDAVILDEAQAIKNPDSQAARAAFRLQAEFRATLSGTPVENRLDELWSQMHFCNRGLLAGRKQFKQRYADPIASGDGEAASRLRARIRPFLLRRLKREVAPELPPRIDAVLHCQLSPDERDLYDAVRVATRRDLLAKLAQGGNVLAALEALLRLRQAACHPGLLPGQDAWREQVSAKVRVLIDALELAVIEDHKALVFSQWTSMLDLIEPALAASGIEWVRLDGSTRDRGAVVRRFQGEDGTVGDAAGASGPPVMLISLKAGGTGLNLTAADYVFLCDPWWNPAVEDQAADRAHRIGQDRPVNVYRLVAQDTVEERILALQTRKRALADAALADAGGAVGLTRDDLLALLA